MPMVRVSNGGTIEYTDSWWVTSTMYSPSNRTTISGMKGKKCMVYTYAGAGTIIQNGVTYQMTGLTEHTQSDTVYIWFGEILTDSDIFVNPNSAYISAIVMVAN